MTALPQGLVKTVTAGTRVKFPAVAAPGVPTQLVCRILVSQAVGTTGAVSIGDSTVVHATKVGVARQFLAPGASGFLDESELIEADGNMIDPTQFYVDSAVNGEGVIVTYYQQ